MIVENICCQGSVLGYEFYFRSKGDPDSAKVKGQISRELAKLRAHGLIRKVPHSRRYLVSGKGRRVMGALIESKRKIYPELAAE